MQQHYDKIKGNQLDLAESAERKVMELQGNIIRMERDHQSKIEEIKRDYEARSSDKDAIKQALLALSKKNVLSFK